MAKVGSQRGQAGRAGGPRPLERAHQIAGAAANVQHARLGTRQHLPHARHGVRAPVAIDIERKQMVGQVVAMRHAAEHGAHPLGRLLLATRALWRRALHARAAWMAVSTSSSSMPDTTCTSPMRSGNTKWTLPWMVFLSLTKRASKRSAAIPASEGIGPYSRMASRMSTVSSAERWPVICARYTAARMPNATASPCRKRV